MARRRRKRRTTTRRRKSNPGRATRTNRRRNPRRRRRSRRRNTRKNVVVVRRNRAVARPNRKKRASTAKVSLRNLGKSLGKVAGGAAIGATVLMVDSAVSSRLTGFANQDADSYAGLAIRAAGYVGVGIAIDAMFKGKAPRFSTGEAVILVGLANLGALALKEAAVTARIAEMAGSTPTTTASEPIVTTITTPPGASGMRGRGGVGVPVPATRNAFGRPRVQGFDY